MQPLPVIGLQLCHNMRRDERVAQPLPDIFYGSGRGVGEVIGIETVVTQLVQHNLVGGEITHQPGVIPLQLFDSQEQHRLAELVLMQTVALVADRADSEHPVLVRHSADERTPGCDYLLNSQPLACELAFGQFVAVGYNLSVSVIDIRSPERYKHYIRLLQSLMKFSLRLQAASEHLFAIRTGERTVVCHGMKQSVVLHNIYTHIAVERLYDG